MYLEDEAVHWQNSCLEGKDINTEEMKELFITDGNRKEKLFPKMPRSLDFLQQNY